MLRPRLLGCAAASLTLPGIACAATQQILAILQEGNSQVPLWELATRQVTNVETNLKDPSFLKWSRTGPQLAIGTGKGNLLIYNKTTRKKERILGKHSRKITCGAWSNDNRLALGGMDNMLTLRWVHPPEKLLLSPRPHVSLCHVGIRVVVDDPRCCGRAARPTVRWWNKRS